MELEEMKSMWQKYDALLQQNKLLNEQLITGMLKNKSENAASRILRYEYLGAITSTILILGYVAMFNTAFTDAGMAVCYLFSLLWMVISLLLFYRKYNMLSSLNFGQSTISHMAESIERFRLLMVKERLISMCLSPLLIFTVFVVLTRWIHHDNVFDHIADFMPRIIAGSVLAVAGIAFIYRSIYFKSIKDIKHNLSEIESFKQ